jgi:hypothetical protein
MAHIRQIRQIAPDCLQGHIKALRQILDDHPPLGAGNLKDLGLTETQRHSGIPFSSLVIAHLRKGKPGNQAEKVSARARGNHAASQRENARIRVKSLIFSHFPYVTCAQMFASIRNAQIRKMGIDQ